MRQPVNDARWSFDARRAACLIAVVGLAWLPSCSSRTKGDPGQKPDEAKTSGAESPHEPEVVLDWIRNLDDCTLGHRGTLLDLGDATMRSRYGDRLGPADVVPFERDGSTWVHLKTRQVGLSFVTTEPITGEAGLTIAARARGGTAKSLSVSLDGKPVGHLALTHLEAKVSEVKSAVPLEAGAHRIDVRFVGGAKSTPDALGEIDWIRIGPSDGDAPYAAPTRRDALVSTAVGGKSQRAISLRGNAFARCTGYVPSDAVFKADLAVTGGGDAEIEVRVLRDRKEPAVVAHLTVGGTDATTWRPFSVPLGDLDAPAAVELSVTRAQKGTRVLFGEARVTRAKALAPKTPRPPARGVVLVVLGTSAPKTLTAFGGARRTPELAKLIERGFVFERNRAVSTLTNATVASMFSGVGPREHGVVDVDARLSKSPTIVSEALREAGITTAFFTANPTTSEIYGFERGWETFRAHGPTEDTPATAVFDDAIRFVEQHKADRFFVAIHARGGHPPWDASADQMKDLPPKDYTGGLDPKHAGELLAKARRIPPVIRYTDGDKERAAALHTLAVEAHDAALGRLLSALRLAGRDEDTVVIVTGDVTPDETAHVPFAETDAIDEPALATLLVVRPHKGVTGQPGTIASPTENMHIASTILDAFALASPAAFRATSLFTLAETKDKLEGRPRVALAAGKFSARFGDLVLSGTGDRETKLCDLALEPACQTDVRATHPLATETLHRRLFDTTNAPQKTIPPREDARLDPPAAAALKAWGR